jgi:excisionase family DNA binding protein
MSSKLLNAKDVSERLGGIAYENVLRMAKTGELPSFKIGRRVRFLESEITTWIKKQKAATKR